MPAIFLSQFEYWILIKLPFPHLRTVIHALIGIFFEAAIFFMPFFKFISKSFIMSKDFEVPYTPPHARSNLPSLGSCKGVLSNRAFFALRTVATLGPHLSGPGLAHHAVPQPRPGHSTQAPTQQN